MPFASPRSDFAVFAARLTAAFLGLALASAALAADKADDRGGIDADRFFGAILKVRARALPDARTAATLGQDREGTGVVIGSDGLVLTIGYLILEAEEVSLVDARGRTLPASVVAYDHASGLALVRSVVPLDASPLPLGDSTRLAESDPVLIVNHGGRDAATLAYVVSRRPFTGSWEYLLDNAIFTSPPTLDWSGAALIGRDGSLLGIGSLILRDATEADPHLPGNLFVPIDLLKPIMDDLVRTGHRAGPARPWLGVSADEIQGRLLVSRVSPDGPADKAGVRTGDIILAVGSEAVHSQAEFYRKLWSRGAAGSEIPLRVLQGEDVHEVKVRSIDRVDYFRRKPVY
ncbi:MAG TPA: S1C family serine protease [Casimicrobiaceae bacterium]|nr:S1C family serine protease [Casimicrobiaceae bacterium]